MDLLDIAYSIVNLQRYHLAHFLQRPKWHLESYRIHIELLNIVMMIIYF